MRSKVLLQLISLAFYNGFWVQAAPAPAPPTIKLIEKFLLDTRDQHIHVRQNEKRDSVPGDYDLSSITKLAAIGDSYSAGIGAGDRLGSIIGALDPKSDWSCSRYDHSYPYLVNTDPRLGDTSKRNFQFKSCSGAVIKDVLDKQIPDLNSNQQAILLSIGGNDAQLTNILNQCVFQWAVLNPMQVAVAKAAALTEEFAWAGDYDWETLGRGCDGQLQSSRDIIESSDFSDSLDRVVKAAKEKLGDGGKIYWTGYAKFFNEDYTSECDSVSWSTWIYKAADLFRPDEKLDSFHRRAMNSLVDLMNSKLKDAVKRAGDQVQFVDYDAYVGHWTGRYCEPGVDEATVESNTRPRLMFYELNTWDPFGTNPWKRSTNGDLDSTFIGNLDIYAQITTLVDPGATFREQAIDTNTTGDPTIPSVQTHAHFDADTGEVVVEAVEVPNILPDGYGRVFHPQILLHRVIANMIIWQMINTHQTENNNPGYPQTLRLNTCPALEKRHEPLDKFGDCGSDLANFEKTTYDDAVKKFCDDHGDLTKSANVQYGQNDISDPVFQKWSILFKWDPADDSGSCSHDCSTIFGSGFTTPTSCRYNSHTMATTGSLQLDSCGTASFELKGNGPAATEEKIFDQQCSKESDYPGHPDVHENFVDNLAEVMCSVFATHTIKKDDSSTYPYWQNAEYFGNRGTYSMRAAWKDGCVLPNDKTEVSAQNPLPQGASGADVSCYDLFYNNWRNCNNGGTGGSIQVGCIIYDFYPKWRDLDFCCR